MAKGTKSARLAAGPRREAPAPLAPSPPMTRADLGGRKGSRAKAIKTENDLSVAGTSAQGPIIFPAAVRASNRSTTSQFATRAREALVIQNDLDSLLMAVKEEPRPTTGVLALKNLQQPSRDGNETDFEVYQDVMESMEEEEGNDPQNLVERPISVLGEEGDEDNFSKEHVWMSWCVQCNIFLSPLVFNHPLLF